MSTTTRHPRGGFTLLELILVILVIFTFVAVVAPRFSDFVPALRVKRAADELMATARKAHADSALHGFHYRLNFDKENGEYWLTARDNPFNDAEEWTALPGVWGERTKFPDGVMIESEDQYEFRSDGTATEGTITLSNDKEDRIVIQINGTTGKVYIEDEEE